MKTDISFLHVSALTLIFAESFGASFGRVEEKVKKYVGLGILSQAGVAIGLSFIVRQEFSQLNIQYDLPHATTIAAIALTTITTTCQKRDTNDF